MTARRRRFTAKTGNDLRGGMTLVELLVAFVILLMIIGALVSLTTRSLESWTEGETRKERYDRARTVLDALVSDLRNLYVENEIFLDGQKVLLPPILACDLDRNRAPRLRFVRSGHPSVVKVPGGTGAPARLLPPMYYGATWEIAYVPDPEPERAVLWRAVRPFDRQPTAASLLRPPPHYNRASDGFGSRFVPVESGVLWVGYRFWTQFTTTWDDAHPVRRVGPRSRQPSGPERRWDSWRRDDKEFFFHRRAFDPTNPDFVYPEIVAISVTVEGAGPETHGVRLLESCDERSSVLRLTHTQGLPDPPSFVKIGAEWIEYAGKTSTELTGLRRGRRDTAAAPHPAGAAVRFGETFTTEVRLPVYREAQEP